MSYKHFVGDFAPLLSEAKQWVERERNDGAVCPCCGRVVRVYKRAMNSAQAQFLITLLRRRALGDCDEDGHMLVAWGATGNGDYSKLRYWGLIEKRQGDDPGTPDSGWWRITRAGEAFARGEDTAPSHAYVCKNDVVEFSETKVTIRQVLGTKFDYDELMRATYEPAQEARP